MSDLIQYQSASMRRFKPTGLFVGRARKSAAFIAEKFGFKQAAR
jgi:hypothetical protein